MRIFFLSFLLLFCISAIAQQANISGVLVNQSTGEKLKGAMVTIPDISRSALTDSNGRYIISNIPPGNYTMVIHSLGHYDKQVPLNVTLGVNKVVSVSLLENALNLKEVNVQASRNNYAQGNTISKIDIQLKPVNNSQELLTLIPGLFVAQHAGGGKAEQIFLRGFDVDHGTDFAIFVDGMPVNMVSHAHGQGYADLHFVIPETVEELNVYKGTYSAKYGDLATAGAGEFKTLNALNKSMVKLQYGSFNSFRTLAMVDLLQGKRLLSKLPENAYAAVDYNYSDSYFDQSQNFNRFNAFGKYHGFVNERTLVTLSLSTFNSTWDASGQIPQRKVDDGTIGRYGSIDPSEGGQTSRTNANLAVSRMVGNGTLKNQIYYSKYDFNLFSNFTFFLKDSVNGDEIQQTDNRQLAGYMGTYSQKHSIAGKDALVLAGIGARYDRADILLGHAVKRELISTKVSGLLNQLNTYAFVDEQWQLTRKLKVNPGIRLDQYVFDFHDRLYDTASGTATKARVSPKLNLFYDLKENMQLFAKSGIGFHSNDARAIVAGKLSNTLPKAFGYETGFLIKPGSKTIINFALWGLDLESELVYVGDEGIVEVSGRTRRLGVDIGLRQNITGKLFADIDLNYSHGRLRDEPARANYIPLAPWFTSTGGLSYKSATGFGGSLRYRYMADRPANEEGSVTAHGYILVDAAANYTWKKFQLGFSVQNLLNSQWNEAQFDTESRLQNETAPVSELHFTPGTPFRITGNLTYFF